MRAKVGLSGPHRGRLQAVGAEGVTGLMSEMRETESAYLERGGWWVRLSDRMWDEWLLATAEDRPMSGEVVQRYVMEAA